jgi:hypothetical protein
MAKIHPSIVVILCLLVTLLAASSLHPTTAFAIRLARRSSHRNKTAMKSSSDNDNQAVQDTLQDDKASFEVQTWNPLRLAVLRLGLTEPALNYGKKDGTFRCAYCGQTLFDSNAKYDSGRCVKHINFVLMNRAI